MPIPNVPPSRRSRRWPRSSGQLALACLALLFPGCSHAGGPYVWVNDYPVQSATDEYVIGSGDILDVQVWDNQQMTTKVRVRSDGRISVPLVSDVDATGKTPRQLATELERALRDGHFVLNPRVTVAVEESRPILIPVLGSVAHPGNYAVEPGAGVAVAIASAGGLTDFAHEDRIFVVRKTPSPARIRFTMRAIASAVGRAPTFRLQSGDVVYVQ